MASLDQYLLNQGTYTIAYRGTVTGPPAGVGSNITFAAASAVPEPATWGLMILGFGGVGFVLRRRARTRTRVRFA